MVDFNFNDISNVLYGDAPIGSADEQKIDEKDAGSPATEDFDPAQAGQQAPGGTSDPGSTVDPNTVPSQVDPEELDPNKLCPGELETVKQALISNNLLKFDPILRKNAYKFFTLDGLKTCEDVEKLKQQLIKDGYLKLLDDGQTQFAGPPPNQKRF